MKKKLKDFFTLTRKAEGGFTLVELIVVIAILAILGGVAVPAYSGYVEKANRAADEQLLAHVNQAFAAACIENGTDAVLLDSAYATLNDDGTVAAVYRTQAGDSYNVAFDKYYDMDEDGAFKIFKMLTFKEGMFVEGNSLYANLIAVLQEKYGDELAALKLSAFVTELGTESLLSIIGSASDLIAGLDDSSDLYDLAHSDGAVAALFATLGVANEDEFYEYMLTTYPQGDMDNDTYEAFFAAKVNEIYANNAILYAAQGTSADDYDEMMDILSSTTSVKDVIKSATNTQSMLAQSAMAFAMYSAYTGNNSLEGVALTDIYAVLDSDGFKTYLTTDEGKNDLTGYLAGMDVINGGISEEAGAATDVLLNGYTNEDFAALLATLIAD